MTLPPVDASLIPAHVRRDGPQAMETYSAALAFERSLLEQLTQQLASTAQPSEEDGEAGLGGAARSPYLDMLPGTLADGLAAGGGVGLAEELYRSFRLRLGEDAS